MLNKDCISFSDLFLVCLGTTDHLILKLMIFSGHTASFKIEISKVQDFGNFDFSPTYNCFFEERNNLINKGICPGNNSHSLEHTRRDSSQTSNLSRKCKNIDHGQYVQGWAVKTTHVFNRRLKLSRSICQKVVNPGQYESEWSIENFKWPF